MLSRKNYCIDCKKEISRGSIRCKSCAAIERWKYRERKPKVLMFCIDCGIRVETRQRCLSCALTHWWKDRRKPQNVCVVCGTNISDGAKRCQPCFLKILPEIRSQPSETNIHLNYCIDCGIPITLGKTKRCRPCASNTPERKIQLSKSSKGRTWSKEQKRKHSKLLTKVCSDLEYKKKVSRAQIIRWKDPEQHKQHSVAMTKMWESGMVDREARNEKISKANSGVNAPNWQGGKLFEPYTPDFNNTLKRKIRKRDDHICILCDAPEGVKHHHIHHIDYNKGNNSPDNLITLCPPCHHRTTHNRDYWIAGLESIRGNYV